MLKVKQKELAGFWSYVPRGSGRLEALLGNGEACSCAVDVDWQGRNSLIRETRRKQQSTSLTGHSVLRVWS